MKILYVSKTGNDTSDGLLPETALATVARAKEMVQDGDRVVRLGVTDSAVWQGGKWVRSPIELPEPAAGKGEDANLKTPFLGSVGANDDFRQMAAEDYIGRRPPPRPPARH